MLFGFPMNRKALNSTCASVQNVQLYRVIIIRFHDEATQKRALGFLIGRFSGHSWATGEVAVPEEALVPMAREGILFVVEGPATHERILSLRNSLAIEV